MKKAHRAAGDSPIGRAALRVYRAWRFALSALNALPRGALVYLMVGAAGFEPARALPTAF